MEEKICEHCDNPTQQLITVYIEETPFTGHSDCMEELLTMYEEGRYTLEDYIRELKNKGEVS